MSGIRFTDTQGHEDVVALGLPAGRLALVGAGLAGTLAAFNLPIPDGLRGVLGACLLLVTAALAWLRLGGLPLMDWARRGVRFGLRQRIQAARAGGDWVRTDPGGGWGAAAE
jgi:hypothetical protein